MVGEILLMNTTDIRNSPKLSFGVVIPLNRSESHPLAYEKSGQNMLMNLTVIRH